MQLGLLGAGLVAARHEAQASTDLAARAEPVRIFEGQDVRQGSDGSHALDVAQQAGHRIAGFRDLFDLSIVGPDAFREGGEGRQDGSEGRQEFFRDGGVAFQWKPWAEEEGRRAPVVLTTPRA